MKLAIVVGHNSQAQGAVRSDTGETEYVWNGRLAQRMEALASEYDLDLRVFRRTPGGGYTAEIRRVYAEVDRWGADASLELHFNGAADPAATGTETLSSGTALSLRLAAAVQDEMVIALGLRDRGIKTVSGSDRGGMSLIAGSAPAILVEPFFGSSPKGQAATDEDREQDRLARAYLRGARTAMASFPRSTLTNSRTLDATDKQRTAAQTGALASVGAVVSQMADTIVGTATSVQDAAGIGRALEEFLPWAGGALALIAMALFIYSRHQANRIEEARIDDHAREIR